MNNKVPSKDNENKFANKKLGTPSKTYIGSSNEVDPPILNNDQRFGTKSMVKTNSIHPNKSISTIPNNYLGAAMKAAPFLTEEMRYQLETTNNFISEYNKQATISSDLKGNKHKIKSVPMIYADSGLNIPQKSVSSYPSKTFTEPSIHTNIDPKIHTVKNFTTKRMVETNSIQPLPEMYSSPNTPIFTITDNGASTTSNLPTKSSQAAIKTSGSSKVIAKPVSGHNGQANEYENAVFDEFRSEVPNLIKEKKSPDAYCFQRQVDAEQDETIVDNYTVADETRLFDESTEGYCSNYCCIIL